jgi:phage gpG-like protein
MSAELNLRDMITPDLRRALDKMKDKGPILQMAAAACIGIAEQSFNNPGMRISTWPELTPETIKRKGHDKPLKDTGVLMRSLIANAPQKDSIEIGSDRVQANAQNFGYRQIPARPFIPIDDKGNALPAAEKAMKDAMEARLKTMLPK